MQTQPESEPEEKVTALSGRPNTLTQAREIIEELRGMLAAKPAGQPAAVPLPAAAAPAAPESADPAAAHRTGAGKPSLARADFERLTPTERNEFVRKGGKIHD